MKLKIFVCLLLILTIAGASLFYHQLQDPSLQVDVAVWLHVRQESSAKPGYGWINNENTNGTLAKWPRMATENVDLNLEYDRNVTRSTPVQFNVTLILNQTERFVTTSNLTQSGTYVGSISSFFSGIKLGTYNLTIMLRVCGSPEIEDRFSRFITLA